MVAVAMRVALVALVALGACVGNGAGETTVGTRPVGIDASLKGPYTYEAYTPGSWVKYYHKETFPEDPGEDMMAYMKEVLMNHVLYLVIFGVVVLALFVFWSCGSMECCAKKNCCCAKCCADPPKIFSNKCGRLILTIVGGVLVLCIFSISMAGLDNEKKQDTSISDLGSILNVLTDWTNFTTGQLAITKHDINNILVITKNMTEWAWQEPNIESQIATYGGALADAMNATSQQISVINTTVQDTNAALSKTKDDVSTSTNDFNEERAYLVTTAYSVVVVIIVAALLIAILKMVFPNTCAKKMRCCFGIFNIGYFGVLVITFVVVVLLYIMTLVVADFCFTADTNFVNALAFKKNDTFTYYVTCDTDATLVNPFKPDCETVEAQMANAQTQLLELDKVVVSTEDAITRLQKNPSTAALADPYKADLAALKWQGNELKLTIGLLNVSIGQDLTDMGFQSGLLSSLHCYQLNLRYNAVIWQVCDTVYNPLAQSMEYCLAIFILLVVVDWVRRWLRPTREQKGMKVVERRSKVQPVDIQPVYQNHDGAGNAQDMA